MRILLTNDDGIHAPGLKILEAIARSFSDDVTIVAPAEEQSGKGRSLTLNEPLRVRHHGDRRMSVSGTPTDAVMYALAEVMKDAPPDLVLSGVNRGGNLGEDVFYSGTIGAAMEGALAGKRAIALSQRYGSESPGANVSFDAAEQWGARVVRPLLDLPLAARTVININFPPIPADAVKGVRVVHQGLRDYGRVKLVQRTDPRGFPYYWNGLGRVPHTPVADTDLEAIELGYVTVTPLQMDLTHRASVDMLAGAYRDEDVSA